MVVAVASHVGWPNPLGLGDVVCPGNAGGMSLIMLSSCVGLSPFGTSSKFKACRVFQATMWSVQEVSPLTPSPPISTPATRSEEHTSELQSRRDLVCRLL